MTVHNPPERALDSQQAVDLVVALQRCLTRFHADQAAPPILEGEAADRRAVLGRYIRGRGARATLFGQSPFSDPAWDILLLLFQAELDDDPLTLEQISETGRLSLNATVGQVGVLERRGLVYEYRGSPNSRRRRALRLTPLAVDAMSSWFTLTFGPDA